jgi:hypothetical protein
MPKLYNDLDAQGLSIINAKLGVGTAAPTAANTIQSRSNRVEFHDGTSAKFLATLDDVTGATPFRGGYDASGGALPTATTVTRNSGTALTAGQFVLITVGGTIANIGGADTLASGDLLWLLGNDAAVATNWYGVSRGLDLTPYIISGSTTMASVTTGAAQRVAPPTAIKTVTNYVMMLAGGVVVPHGSLNETLTRTGATNGISVTTGVALSNLEVHYTGLAV